MSLYLPRAVKKSPLQKEFTSKLSELSLFFGRFFDACQASFSKYVITSGDIARRSIVCIDSDCIIVATGFEASSVKRCCCKKDSS